ncbi:MAG: large subunit ribosomal protein L17 [Cyclobacteriaceae bacterium]|jgi:large subunit ribosomal protein L17
MATSLIIHKRINTTLAKAKALRKYVEPLITKAKDNTTHSRRTVFSYLQDKESVTELFTVVADKAANRPGGYTRIIKLGARLGDNADMCIMELVDFNELLMLEEKPKKARRSRRGGKSKEASDSTETVLEAEVVAEEPEAAVEVEEVKEEASEATVTDIDEDAPEASDDKKDEDDKKD